MTQHTPEPWKIIDYYQREIGQSHNCTVARMFNPPVGHSDANARRIVACVNACAGIPTSALEVQSGEYLTASQIVAMRESYVTRLELDLVKQQRDELLDALKLSRHGLHSDDEHGACLCYQCEFVRARNKAIAKAGGI